MAGPDHTLGEVRALLNSGATSVVQLTEQSLSAARDHQHLNAFLETFEESALSSAARVDARLKAGNAGRLAGLTIALKDNLCYRGHRVSASSKILEGYVSPYSATVVERLLQEDAVIIGRTNCDEFAMGSSNENSAFGPVGHPLDPKKVPGGSSGGSAVSVAASITRAALGSDTGGSIRQPASFSGVVGFQADLRPGLAPWSHRLRLLVRSDRSVRLLGGGCGTRVRGDRRHDPHDSTTSSEPVGAVALEHPGRSRIAYYKECIERPGLDPEIKAHLTSTIDRLKKEGHTVEAIELPMLDHLVPAYYILATAEASSNLARFDGIRYGYRSKAATSVEGTYRLSRSEGFGPEVKRRILLGTFVLSAGYYDAYYAKGQRVRRLLRDATMKSFERYDLILTPTSPTTSFERGSISDPVAMYLQDIFTVQANLTGMPAISLPVGKHSSGMPFGMQLMARPFDEARLLAAGRHLFGA
jgi:aspartyl-tRNA(Asn)/glutamyl-tRNA(Gln) amidotransferase subunit A